MRCRLGSLYNAIPGNAKKQRVKQWAWEVYPQIYEDLMKCGQYEVIRGDREDEEEQEFSRERQVFFDIRSIGGEPKP